MTSDDSHTPSTEHILKRLLQHDMEGIPGWQLNTERRHLFAAMLQERQKQRQR
jgi:hypothetical protein